MTITDQMSRFEQAAADLENAYRYLSDREDADGGTDDWTDDGAGNLALRAITGAQRLLEELDNPTKPAPVELVAALALGVHPALLTPEQIARAQLLIQQLQQPLPPVGTILLFPGMARVIEVGPGYQLTSLNFHWKLDNTYEVLGFEVFKAEVLKDCLLLFTPDQVQRLKRTGRRVSDIIFRLRLHGDDWLATAKRWIAAGRID